eukprot:c3738_g1_i1 orf=693-908(-)
MFGSLDVIVDCKMCAKGQLNCPCYRMLCPEQCGKADEWLKTVFMQCICIISSHTQDFTSLHSFLHDLAFDF